MTVRNKNFSEVLTPDILDEEYIECNFSKKSPDPVLVGGKPVGVRIFPGDDTPRTFVNCNLVNCKVPPGSTVTGDYTNTTISDLNVPDDTNNRYITTIYGTYKDGVPEYFTTEKTIIKPYRTRKYIQIVDTGEHIKPEVKVVSK